MKKRILSLLLAFVMLFCLAPAAVFAEGETDDGNDGKSTDLTVKLGADRITTNDTVYFGVYSPEENKSYNVPWYVIGMDTTNGTAFLAAKYTLGRSEFNAGGDHLYSGSTLESKMSELYGSLFTAIEKETIKATTLSGSSMHNDSPDIENAYLFALSSDEASSLGWASSKLQVKDITEPNGDAIWWWTRTSQNKTSYYNAHCYNGGGYLKKIFVSYWLCYARPAFNMNLDSVLFSTVISTADTGSVYKFTLSDENMTIAKTKGEAVKKCGSLLTIPYSISGTDSANATEVSVLVLDAEYTAGNTNNANILAYGKLNTESFSVTGSGTFALPDSLDGKTLGSDYFVYILAADVNGTYETDYASAPVEIGDVVEVAEAPVSDKKSETYTENQSVELSSATEGAAIYYTTDGTDPSFDEDGNPTGTTKLYSGAVSVTGTQGKSVTTTIKAVTVKSEMLNSDLSEFTYIISIPHTHGFDGAEWQMDDTKHWKECTNENCDKSEGYIEEAEHSAGDWITDKEATTEEVGSRHKECTVCGKVVEEEEIAKIVSPQTGDGNISLLLALLIVGGGTVAAALAGKKRKYGR